MAINESRPVLVVGAGPAGLAAALELTRHGQRACVVDKQPERSELSKAIGINARTLELLEASGVTERLLALGRRVPGFNLFENGRRLFRIDFDALDHRYNFMIALPQHHTERELELRLRELGGEVEWNVTLETFTEEPDHVKCVLSHQDGRRTEFEASYLIGGDGAHSTVRERLGLAFRGDTMPGCWSLADVHLSTEVDRESANVILTPAGMLFMIRIRGDRFRVASRQPNVLDLLPEDSVVHDVVWKADFSVSHRLVTSYRVGRVFLAGDAAHLHSPLGGHGMNLAIEDATLLARMIVVGDVERYASERRRAAASAIRMIRAQTGLVVGSGLTVRAMRRFVIPRLLGLGGLRRRFVARALGLS